MYLVVGTETVVVNLDSQRWRTYNSEHSMTPAPGTKTLRPHQIRLKSLVRKAVAEGKRRIVCVMPTGGGKSLSGCDFAKSHLEKGGKAVLWITHREELLQQSSAALAEYGLTSDGVTIASVQTLLARDWTPPASLVIFDECVTGGTVVGGRRAEDIRVGDLVECWSGERVVLRPVTHVFRNPASSLRTIHMVNRSLSATDNHPIWVENTGYVELSRVKVGDMCRLWGADESIYKWKCSQDLFSGVPKENESPETSAPVQGVRQGNSEGTVDSQGVFSAVRGGGGVGDHDCHERASARSDKRPHDEQQSNVSSGDPCKVFRVSAQDQSSTSSRWQRTRVDCSSGEASQCPGGRLDTGGKCWLSGQSRALDDRHCAHTPSRGNRGGWSFPSLTESEGQRCAKDSATYLARVDRIEVHERGSDGTFGGRCPEGFVYNFEVEEFHNFFANGVLTHNCHHAVSESWITILQKYPEAIILGLTATPERGDKIGLGDFFDHLVVGATYSELRASGVLVPCEILSPKFTLKSQTIAQRPVDAYLEHARGLKTVVFSSNTEAAQEHLQQFLDAGIRAAFIHYKSTDREQVLQDFAANRLDVLINLSLLCEGWNVPAVECCILARTCGSIGLYIQMVGRVLRASPGKQRGLLLDLTGQSRKHGPPDQDWIFSLDGKPIRRKGEKIDARFCAICGMVINADASICPDCGSGPDPLHAPSVTGEKLEKYGTIRKRSAESKRTHYFQMLDKCAKEGHHTGRAYHRYKAVYAEEPEWNWTRDWKKLHANDQIVDRKDNRLE